MISAQEREFYEQYTTGCMNGSGASCVCACPFNLEIGLFIDKVKLSGNTGAYRLYQEHVVFPEIVSRICPAPCQAHCVFGEDAVRLPLLERSCVANAREKKPSFYNMPAKAARVAIIGAGLSGLACALKLCMKNYQVTVFEKSDRIGGHVWDLLDEEVFMEDIETQFEDFTYDLHLNTEIRSLDDLHPYAKNDGLEGDGAFDAVYVATGSEGENFGLADGMDHKSYGSVLPGFFLGGRLIGGSDMDAIEHGKIASFSIEKYIQIKKMDGVDTTFHKEQCFFSAPKAAQKGCSTAVVPSDGELYSSEEIAAEAGRCIKCDCSACYDRCALMQSIQQYPVKMVKDALVSMFPIPELEGRRISTRVIGTCLQCGACKDFCPSGIDMEAFFRDFRRMMREEGALPMPFHDFFLQDMQFAEGDDVCLVRGAPDGLRGEFAFFPGCQLGGVLPEAVERTYALLLEQMPGTSLMMTCCGVPALWGGEEEMFQGHLDRLRESWASLGKPTLILACLTCQKTFSAFLPEISTLSLYEVLAGFSHPGQTATKNATRFATEASTEASTEAATEVATEVATEAIGDVPRQAVLDASTDAAPEFAAGTALGSAAGTAAVFDPCSSRRVTGAQESVRILAKRAGLNLVELDDHGPEAECCSYGGHTHFARSGYTDAIVARQAAKSDLPYLVYCANCKESFVEKGKDCRHILEVLFALEPRQEAVTKSDRRQNRRRLKADMCKAFWGETLEEVFTPYGSLSISEAIEKKMSSGYIVADDILAAILQAEGDGRVVYDPETRIRTAHLRVGARTFWAQYIKEEDSRFELVNAYSHRLNIED